MKSGGDIVTDTKVVQTVINDHLGNPASFSLGKDEGYWFVSVDEKGILLEKNLPYGTYFERRLRLDGAIEKRQLCIVHEGGAIYQTDDPNNRGRKEIPTCMPYREIEQHTTIPTYKIMEAAIALMEEQPKSKGLADFFKAKKDVIIELRRKMGLGDLPIDKCANDSCGGGPPIMF